MKAIEALPYFLSGHLLGTTQPNSQYQLPFAGLKPEQIGPLIGGLADRFIPVSTPTKIETLNTTYENSPDVKRLQITYGPFKLRASNSKKKEGNFFSFDPQGTGWSYLASKFPSNITVLGAKMSITLPDGERISNSRGVYNHHAFFYDISKPLRSNMQCEGQTGMSSYIPAMSAIAASAADAGDPKLNTKTRPKVGNYVAPGSKILVTGDLVNYNNVTQEVYMTADIQYVDGKAVGVMESEAHLIAAGVCEKIKQKGAMGFLEALFVRPPVNQKKFSIKGSGLKVVDDGKLFVLRGHMHDGGVNMEFKLNDKEICDSKAIYKAGTVGTGTGGHAHGGPMNGINGSTIAPMAGHAMRKRDGMDSMISDMTGCMMNMDVKKGDVLSLEALYDLNLHPPRIHPGGGMSEGMALAVVVFGKMIQ